MKLFVLLVLTAALGVALARPTSTLDKCKFCINFAEQFINNLLNIILNVGVVGGCGDLCQKLENKDASLACNILCDLVGVKEFIAIIEKADLDPIYYCELLKTCPIKDDGDAKINSLVVSPHTIVQGDELSILLNFTTVNGTGTGSYSLFIKTVDGIPIGENFLTEPMDPGTYTPNWGVKAAPDPDCDPTQGPCEMWEPGNYTVQIAICNGECGSQHPHSQIYDTGAADFIIKGEK